MSLDINFQSSFSFLCHHRPESTYFSKTGNRIGGVYLKALYREFEDSNFTVQKERTAEEEHLGFLGPVIRAEVGDTIEVVFKNKASRNYSIHAQGVYYNKCNEGALYNDGSTGESYSQPVMETAGGFVEAEEYSGKVCCPV